MIYPAKSVKLALGGFRQSYVTNSRLLLRSTEVSSQEETACRPLGSSGSGLAGARPNEQPKLYVVCDGLASLWLPTSDLSKTPLLVVPTADCEHATRRPRYFDFHAGDGVQGFFESADRAWSKIYKAELLHMTVFELLT
jgi:hypothetical protein